MDPVNQTNTNPQNGSNTQGTSPTPNSNGVIAGAFGGTLPLQPVVSEVMPAFSFDQDDFGEVNDNPIPPNPHYENITDPFVGGVVSATSTSIPSNATIVENTTPVENINATIEEKLPEGTVSLDSLDRIISEDATTTSIDNETITPESSLGKSSEETILNSIQETSLPVEEIIEVVKEETTTEIVEPLTNTDNSLPIVPKNQDISFDVPVDVLKQTNESISFDLPTLEKPVIQDITFDLPNQPNINYTQEVESLTLPNNETITSESPTRENSEETSLLVEEIIEEGKEETTTEITEPLTNTDDSLPIISVSETRNENNHDLQEVYDEFKQSFKEYSTFKGSLSVNIVGLRTQEDEVTYTFTQTKDNNISIIKSNTTDIISFEQTESGLKVSLNNDSLGYYGVDQVDADTTHFLKEKLGKFNMMLQSEYEREEKKQKEGLKKIKESLRNF